MELANAERHHNVPSAVVRQPSHNVSLSNNDLQLAWVLSKQQGKGMWLEVIATKEGLKLLQEITSMSLDERNRCGREVKFGHAKTNDPGDVSNVIIEDSPSTFVSGH